MSDEKKKLVSQITVLEFSNYVRPDIVEKKTQGWVLNGENNNFYQYIIDRNNGSPTNSSVNKSYSDLIWGRGLAPLNVSEDSQEWQNFLEILSEKEARKIIIDFQIFNELSFQTSPERGNRERLAKISHIPKQWVAPEMVNGKGVIETYYVSKDWNKWRQGEYKPMPYPAFGTNRTAAAQLYVSHPYIAGKFYFGDPDYLSGLPYCEMEEEIANLNINSIKNGLSAGYIINVPGGISLSDEEKEEFERSIKRRLTGSPNASRFVLSFNDIDVEITITPFPVNERIHKQWEFLVNEAKQQILTSHRCPSPSIAGIISSSGFSNTADEMDTAEEQLVKRVIKPKQDFILSAFHEVLEAYGIDLELQFLPLTEMQEEQQEEEEIKEDVEELKRLVRLAGFDPNQKRGPDGEWVDLEFRNTYISALEDLKKEVIKAKEGQTGLRIPKELIPDYFQRAAQLGIDKKLINKSLRLKLNKIIRSISGLASLGGIDRNEEILKGIDLILDEFKQGTELSSQMVDQLIQLGEEVDDTWEVVDDSRCDEMTIDELQLNTVFELAQVPVTPRKNSNQDTSIFKIRYKYAGSGEGEREFCKKVLEANKVYRAEDLNGNFNYNEDFAPSGQNTYNLFLYKGGVNCQHWWQRVIYLKKGNKKISVNDAKKLILALDPKDRKDARWKENDKKVAKPAEKQNNWWSLQPNYRDSGVTNLKKRPKWFETILAGFNPNQPRDKGGEWASNGVPTTKKDAVNSYLKGDISTKELFDLAEGFGVDVATKSELEGIINNSFMLGILADTHNIPEEQIVKRIKELLKLL